LRHFVTAPFDWRLALSIPAIALGPLLVVPCAFLSLSALQLALGFSDVDEWLLTVFLVWVYAFAPLLGVTPPLVSSGWHAMLITLFGWALVGLLAGTITPSATRRFLTALDVHARLLDHHAGIGAAVAGRHPPHARGRTLVRVWKLPEPWNAR
jgi:hypothetical protein